jgi:hypothetical protein
LAETMRHNQNDAMAAYQFGGPMIDFSVKEILKHTVITSALSEHI